jgi:hypothetical protein
MNDKEYSITRSKLNEMHERYSANFWKTNNPTAFEYMESIQAAISFCDQCYAESRMYKEAAIERDNTAYRINEENANLRLIISSRDEAIKELQRRLDEAVKIYEV